MTRGCFIVIDALDGVGKTTLVRDLAAAMDGVALATPGAALQPARAQVLFALGEDQVARCMFYASSVIAQGNVARALAEEERIVVVDRYWPSTIAYARARGVTADLSGVEALIPAPDVHIVLTLDESERTRRLHARGNPTSADRETLAPAFRDTVLRELRARATIVVDTTGATPPEAVARVRVALDAHLAPR